MAHLCGSMVSDPLSEILSPGGMYPGGIFQVGRDSNGATFSPEICSTVGALLSLLRVSQSRQVEQLQTSDLRT